MPKAKGGVAKGGKRAHNGGSFMPAPAKTAARASSRALPAILLGGAIAGVLDLGYAIAVYSPHAPVRIPQNIASGILGAASFQDGARSAALGVILHFVIAIGAAATYYLASRKLSFMLQHAVLAGMIYGALVYIFMHQIVVPLSAEPSSHLPLAYRAAEFVEHWFFVGLPIAISVRRYSR
jgi:uncharacterized membrane protein YagU involved in acid resistance